jgi:hypothetical protein
VATLGYQRGGRTGPPEPSRTTTYPPPRGALAPLSVTLTQALAGAGHPSALTVRTIARGALDMSRLPDKIILR